MTVYARRGRRGLAYYYDFRLDGRRYTARVGPSRRVAVEAEQVARGRALETRYGREWGLRPRGPGPTIDEFIERDFLPDLRSTLAPSSVTTARYRLCIIAKFLGHFRFGQIAHDTIRQFRDHRLARVSAAQVRQDFYWLRRLFRAARPWLRTDPTVIALPKAPPRHYRLLEVGEARRVYRAIHNDRARAMIMLLALLGLRRAEVCSLRARHVDLRRGLLRLQQEKTGVEKVIPLPRPARQILGRFLPRSVHPDHFLFETHPNQPMAPKTLWWHFNVARRRIGLRGLRLHDLRHTIATRMIQDGVDLPTIGDILGHRAPYRQTARYVAHTGEARKRRALERVSRLFPTGLEKPSIRRGVTN